MKPCPVDSPIDRGGSRPPKPRREPGPAWAHSCAPAEPPGPDGGWPYKPTLPRGSLFDPSPAPTSIPLSGADRATEGGNAAWEPAFWGLPPSPKRAAATGALCSPRRRQGKPCKQFTCTGRTQPAAPGAMHHPPLRGGAAGTRVGEAAHRVGGPTRALTARLLVSLSEHHDGSPAGGLTYGLYRCRPPWPWWAVLRLSGGRPSRPRPARAARRRPATTRGREGEINKNKSGTTRLTLS